MKRSNVEGGSRFFILFGVGFQVQCVTLHERVFKEDGFAEWIMQGLLESTG